jgi:hypothetical protein
MHRRLALAPILLALACTAENTVSELDEAHTDLVEARGFAAPEASVEVVVDHDGVHVDGERLVALHEGALDPNLVENHLVGPLHQRIEGQAVPSDGREAVLAVTATPELRFADLVDLVYTGGRAGFGTYAFTVADAQHEDTRAIVIEPPKFDADGSFTPDPLGLKVVVREAGYLVSTYDLEPTAVADEDGLRLVLADLATKADTHRAAVTADPSVEFARLVHTMDLMAGPTCDFEDHRSCWFSRPMLLAQ